MKSISQAKIVEITLNDFVNLFNKIIHKANSNLFENCGSVVNKLQKTIKTEDGKEKSIDIKMGGKLIRSPSFDRLYGVDSVYNLSTFADYGLCCSMLKGFDNSNFNTEKLYRDFRKSFISSMRKITVPQEAYNWLELSAKIRRESIKDIITNEDYSREGGLMEYKLESLKNIRDLLYYPFA